MTAEVVPSESTVGNGIKNANSAPTAPPVDTPVLRVKRKRNADPIDAFIVANEDRERREKRARTGSLDASDQENVTTVFQLVETCETRDFDDAGRLRATLDRIRTLRNAKQSLKTPAFDVADMSQGRRTEQKAAQNADSRAARYRVSTSRRHVSGELKLLDVEEQKDPEAIPVVSRSTRGLKTKEDELLDNLMPMVQQYLRVSEGSTPVVDPETDYVYDLYYASTSALPSDAPMSRVAELSLDYDADVFLGSSDDSDNNDEGDEDSNAEDHYGNEYPDASDLDDSWDEDGSEAGSEDSYDPYD
ncbi:solute carrier 7, member 6 opposite strand [Thoreauomyces humboldtii]|nr:solute carrier 7, member 6 opposite strand [Thoreauomyces humboldtii]